MFDDKDQARKDNIVTIEQLKIIDTRKLIHNFLDSHNITKDSELAKNISKILLDVSTIKYGADNDWSVNSLSFDDSLLFKDKILKEIKELFEESNCIDSQKPDYHSDVYMKLEKLVDLIMQPNKNTADYQKMAKICDINLGIPRTTFPISNRHQKLHDRLHQADKGEGEISR